MLGKLRMKHFIHHRPDKQGYFLVDPFPHELSDLKVQLNRLYAGLFASFGIRRHALEVINIFKLKRTVDNQVGKLLIMPTSCGLTLAIVLSEVPALGTEDAVVLDAAELEFLGVSRVAHVEFLKHHFLFFIECLWLINQSIYRSVNQ